MSQSNITALVPPVQVRDAFTPAKPFRIQYSSTSKFANPIKRLPIMYAYGCSCGDAIVLLKDGNAVYPATVEEFIGSDWVQVNVARHHFCYGRVAQ